MATTQSQTPSPCPTVTSATTTPTAVKSSARARSITLAALLRPTARVLTCPAPSGVWRLLTLVVKLHSSQPARSTSAACILKATAVKRSSKYSRPYRAQASPALSTPVASQRLALATLHSKCIWPRLSRPTRSQSRLKAVAGLVCLATPPAAHAPPSTTSPARSSCL